MGFPGGTVVKDAPANTGDARNTGLSPGSVRSPGVGNGNPLHYSCLKNSRDRGAWWTIVHGVTKGTERLSTLTHIDSVIAPVENNSEKMAFCLIGCNVLLYSRDM